MNAKFMIIFLFDVGEWTCVNNMMHHFLHLLYCLSIAPFPKLFVIGYGLFMHIIQLLILFWLKIIIYTANSYLTIKNNNTNFIITRAIKFISDLTTSPDNNYQYHLINYIQLGEWPIIIIKYLHTLTDMNHLTLYFCKSALLLTLILLDFTTCKSLYKVVDIKNTISSVAISAKYTGPQKYYVKQKNAIISDIVFNFQMQTYSDFFFTIRDANKQRFQAFQSGIYPSDKQQNFTYPINASVLGITYSNDMFDVRIFRKTTNQTIFSTFDTQFIYSDYYLQVGTQIGSDFTIGLGQRFNEGLRLKNGKWTMFNRGRGEVIDNGTGLQTYGYYPFYLQKQKSKLYHAVYIRSSSAMDVIKEEKNGKFYLTFKIIGGIIHFRYFVGHQYSHITLNRLKQHMGSSAIPPYWAMGFHQSRFGYQNILDIENVIEGYQKNNLPLDTIWLDIDYMIDYQDFTIDQSRFPIQKLRKISEKYRIIPIIDAGIAIGTKEYIEGRKRDIFIKDAKGKQFKGSVWPGETVFVDFLHPNASQYWKDMLQQLFSKVNFSGVWLDMNEITNFCNGPCEQVEYLSQFDYSNDLPYNPGFDGIQSMTISLNATHYGGYKQADVHIYAGLLQTYYTYQFLKKKQMRPFILTRSSTFGSGRYGFQWTGDNFADFQFLKSSIPDMIIGQMSGTSFIGSDICGFAGNTTVQLCSRWLQLGVLYPFARNHNTLRAIPQEPYALGDIVLKSASNNLKLRYQLLHHFYSDMLYFGPTYFTITPLFFSFENDQNNFMDEVMNTQFLIGGQLMAAPILEKGMTGRSVYFTTSNWYDYHTGKFYEPGFYRIENISLTQKVPLFLIQSSCILKQKAEGVRSTRDLNNRFQIVAGFKYIADDQQEHASYYLAKGDVSILSNFENETKISQCSQKPCYYPQYLTLVINEEKKTKSVNYRVLSFQGEGLQQLLIIDEITAYYNGSVLHAVLDQPILLNGTTEYDVQFKQNNVGIVTHISQSSTTSRHLKLNQHLQQQ